MSDSQEDLVGLPPIPLEDERLSIAPALFATYPTFLLAHPVILRLTRKKGVDGVVFKVICADTNQLYFEFLQKFGNGCLQFLVDYTGKPVLKVERTDAFTSTIVGGNERLIGQVRCYSGIHPLMKKYVINFTDYNMGQQVLTAEYQPDTQSIEFRLGDESSIETPWLAKMYKQKIFADYQMEIRPGVDIGFMAVLGCLRAQTIRKSAILSPQETHLCALSFQHVSHAPIIYNVSKKIMQLCGNTVIFTPHGNDQAPTFITECVNMSQQMISVIPIEGVQMPVALINGRLSMASACWCMYTKFELDGVTGDLDTQSFNNPSKVTLSLTKLTACWRDSGDINRRIKFVRDISLDLSLEFRLTGVDDDGDVIGQLSKALPKEKGWRQDKDHWGQLQITSGVDLSLMVALSSVLIMKWFAK